MHIKQLREELDMTQAELSIRSGIGISWLSELENQHVSLEVMKVETLKRLAKALGVRASDLVPGL